MSALVAEMIAAWWSWMAPMSLQVIVLVAIVAVLDRLMVRWAWPQLIAAIWLVVLAKLLLPPTLASPVSIARLAPGHTSSPAPVAVTSYGAVPPVAFAFWATGCVLFGGMAARRHARVRREIMNNEALSPPAWFAELAQSAAGRLKLNRPPHVRICRGISGPAVFGFIRPLVLLPAEMFAMASRVEIEHVLLHEFAHVKRRDPLASLVCLIVQLVYWFHPAAWLMRARLATLREVCCDRTVARVLREQTTDYRRTLLNFARRMLEPPTLERRLDRLAFLHGHSQLLARLEWLQRPMAKRRPACLMFAAGLLAVLIACCLPLARPVAPATSIESLASANATQGFQIPPLDELAGCLQLRYAVLGMLAQQESAAGQNALNPLLEESQP